MSCSQAVVSHTAEVKGEPAPDLTYRRTEDICLKSVRHPTAPDACCVSLARAALPEKPQAGPCCDTLHVASPGEIALHLSPEGFRSAFDGPRTAIVKSSSTLNRRTDLDSASAIKGPPSIPYPDVKPLGSEPPRPTSDAPQVLDLRAQPASLARAHWSITAARDPSPATAKTCSARYESRW
jgi:hypothetical protein